VIMPWLNGSQDVDSGIMTWSKRVRKKLSVVLGAGGWIFSHVFSIPGYIDDSNTWIGWAGNMESLFMGWWFRPCAQWALFMGHPIGG